jgi:hypothetical protein
MTGICENVRWKPPKIRHLPVTSRFASQAAVEAVSVTLRLLDFCPKARLQVAYEDRSLLKKEPFGRSDSFFKSINPATVNRLTISTNRTIRSIVKVVILDDCLAMGESSLQILTTPRAIKTYVSRDGHPNSPT